MAPKPNPDWKPTNAELKRDIALIESAYDGIIDPREDETMDLSDTRTKTMSKRYVYKDGKWAFLMRVPNAEN